MTKEEVMTLDMEQLEERAAEIAEETREAAPEMLETIEQELESIEERKEIIKAEAEEKRAKMEEALEEAKVIEAHEEERKIMSDKEIRNSKEYIDAFCDYIRGKNDGTECRALLSENASGGTIPVPTYVEERIMTAWENDKIMQRVRRSNFSGILKVGVEVASDGAKIHTEGGEGIDEENLTISVVNLIPKTIKKMVRVSDEALDANEALLDYLYDEIEYQIVKMAGYLVMVEVNNALSGSAAVPASLLEVTTPSITDIVEAIGKLQGETDDLCFIANRGTIAAYQMLAMQANYAVDPFAGVTVIPTDFFPSFEDQEEGDSFAIVGDLKGIQANFPAGYQPTFKFDDLSEADADMVRIIGRLPVAVGVVKPYAFTVLGKAEASE